MARSLPPQRRTSQKTKKTSLRSGYESIEGWAAREWIAVNRTITQLDHRTYNAFFNPDYGTPFHSQPNENSRPEARNGEDITRSLNLYDARSPLEAYHPPVDSVEELEDKNVREGVERLGATLQGSGAFAPADVYPPGLGLAQVAHFTARGWIVVSTKCPMLNHGKMLFCHSGDCRRCLPLEPTIPAVKPQLHGMSERVDSGRPPLDLSLIHI